MPRAPYLPSLLHHSALQPDQRGREDALKEPEPSALPGWEISFKGAQLGAPSATRCPACLALCSPQTPISPRTGQAAIHAPSAHTDTQQGQAKPPAVPLHPPKPQHALTYPGSPVPERVPAVPACEGRGHGQPGWGSWPLLQGQRRVQEPTLGCTRGPPYPRRPAGYAPSPRSAAGGDAPWCEGSSTRLWEEGLGVGIPAWSPSPAPRSCAPATPHGLGSLHSTPQPLFVPER